MIRPAPIGFLALLGTDGAPPAGAPPWAASWAEGPVWLGAAPDGPARLARRGPLVAVADLRLDNRDDLARALRVPLAGPSAPADAALVLAAVEAWGEGAVERLEGPFSFVVWDGRAGRALYARDGLGLRPLYRRTDRRGTALGSSLPALWPFAGPGLCPGAVADHLTGRMEHPLLTFAPGVERVAPARAGVVEDGRVRERRFWALDPGPVAERTDAAHEAAFREAFDAAVGARLVPDGRGCTPGAFLSGGLDSSSVVVTARALRPDVPLPTFSIVYDDPAADERRFVAAVAARAGVAPLRVHGDRLALLDGLDGDLAAVGEPFFTPNLFLTRTLYRRAGGAGLGAVLDGFVGDNVVGYGDRLLTELARSLRWRRLAREVAAAARRSRRPRRTALHLAWDYALTPLVRPLLTRLRAPTPDVHFAHPDLGVGRPASEPVALTDRAAQYAELTAPTLPRAFEVAHAVAAAHGVEGRFPFADRRLVALCLALPAEQRLQDGVTRSILRRALSGRLPDVVRDRGGKARLGANFAAALFERSAGALRQSVYEEARLAADVLDVPALQAAYERAAAEPRARAELALPVWRAATLARWVAGPARPAPRPARDGPHAKDAP